MTRRIATWLLCSSLVWTGCTARHYRQSADHEVARIIADRSPGVQNMDPHFTIEQTNAVSLEPFEVFTNTIEFFGPADAAYEQGASRISLQDALDLSVKFNREYQLRKEQVYLAALALTLAQNQFEPIFGGRASAAYRVDTERLKVVVDEVTNEPRVIPSEDGEPSRSIASRCRALGPPVGCCAPARASRRRRRRTFCVTSSAIRRATSLSRNWAGRCCNRYGAGPATGRRSRTSRSPSATRFTCCANSRVIERTLACRSPAPITESCRTGTWSGTRGSANKASGAAPAGTGASAKKAGSNFPTRAGSSSRN